ncbi:DNA polymerase III subunit gamma and tau [Cryobacterium sp. PH31-O1]|uniref:DNA polymerase III subunit gamma and tau n=1 Tax=Cryobacterium sp. PH31-O1 TaxID=3046306 RepID=UPI0024B973F3|nr:DNA polymerase III subunit gamma and tau [Cryobacterium sp. PH31-O1]MDJ0338428.1 DNA polymerase III subunit gamma and tau [Cryobacterium sp. PH31-O1]
MVTALYRRYRPETFAEMIGQSQVTDPLMTALRTNRVNHAYLFSGPRGCGKTTSARILARCLNCAEGPTDTPCGVCPSCVELARDGGGSLDVVEIDAASHNGVDDARDIRERAIFAPARDRYKIFILDEAHMVTPQGFNALLKIVEEPPEHVKFIFATTEPEKVIGTIRSRTHHYPFRLVPPGPMLEYVQQMCETEKMVVAPGVLPLVVRAGGGSPRDTLSLLDQLMAGSDGQTIEYERAVALLGYTSASLLDEAVDAIGARDSAAAFDAVDRVIQTGQDPRRFVEDLLERLRDLIIVAATSVAGAASVLRGVPQDELERMNVQAAAFGPAELSRTADILNAALTEMSGATSPRLHLELMVARALIPATDDTTRGALARVERLERRIGVDGVPAASAASAASSASNPLVEPVETAIPGTPAVQAGQPSAAGAAPSAGSASTPPAKTAIPGTRAAAATQPSPAGPPARPTIFPGAPVTLQQLKDAWPEILEAVKNEKTTAWLVVYTAHVLGLNGDVLALSFPSQADVDSFKQQKVPGMGTSDFLRTAIVAVLGLRVKFIARVEASREVSSPSVASGASSTVAAEPAPAAPAAETSEAAAPAVVPAANDLPSAEQLAARADSPEPAPLTASSPVASVPARTTSAAAGTAGATPPNPASAPTSPPAAATQPPPAAARDVASQPTEGASPVAASTSGWATVAIPGSPDGPAVPVIDDDTADTASPGVPPANAHATPASQSPVRAQSIQTEEAPGGGSADEPWPATAFASQSRGDEPPFDDIPPPFDDDIPPEMDAPADERVSSYEAHAEASAPQASPEQRRQQQGAQGPNSARSDSSQPNATQQNASRPNAGQRDSVQRQHPNASGQRGTTKDSSRAPSFAEKQRYGEAVVREILGATFIEEQPYNAAPRTRNDY